MKKEYVMPVMAIEKFVANTAVAKCTVEGGISYKFDCMKGPNTDTANVIAQADFISGSCNKNMAYAAGINTARSIGTNNHSNNAGGTWTSGRSGNNSYVQVTYSGNVDGLLYGNENGQASNTSVSGDMVVFQSNASGTHRMVAPVINSYSVKASW